MAAKEAKTTKPSSANNGIITIEPLKQNLIQVEIVGINPLVPHAFDEKAKKEIAAKQAEKEGTVKKGKKKLPPRDPQDEFERSLYWKGGMPEKKKIIAAIQTATFQFPAKAIKAACVQAARMVTGLSMKEARQLLFVLGTEESGGEMVDIITPGPPVMRCDTVRIGGMSKVTDLRYRGEFKTWRARLEIQYDAELTTPNTIVNLLNRAGFSVGILEMRPLPSGPGCGDNFGRFKVDAQSITLIDSGEV